MGLTVLFLPYPSTSGTWGSTLYLAAVAEACAQAGHRVVFHACPPSSSILATKGFDVVECEGATPRGSMRPIDSFYDVFESLGFDDPGFWSRTLAAEDELIEALRPDVIVSDLHATAPIAAKRHRIPLASLGGWATDPRSQARGDHRLDTIARELASTWAGWQVDSAPELVFWHADARLATSFPAFEPDLAELPRLRFTGYLSGAKEGGPIGREVPERLVLAYTSTAPWGTERLVKALGTAAEAVGGTVWCVTRAGGRAGQVSQRCEVFSYLPFEPLLAQAAAMVFHGGQGTSLASVYHGVPTLAVPGANYERRYNADRLAALGVGVHGDLGDLRPRMLSSILERIIDNPTVAAAAGEAASVLGGYRGPLVAVEAIQELVDRR